MNKILKAPYDVRGELPKLASKLEKEGKKIIYCNIGNPLALDPSPIIKYREFISEQLVKQAKDNIVQKDIGSYSPSIGFSQIINSVNNYIADRDKQFYNNEVSYLTNGATEGISTILKLYLWCDEDVILLPRPAYPIYHAYADVYGGAVEYYDLDENYHINPEKIIEKIELIKMMKKKLSLLVIINPNNPTGSISSYNQLKEVAKISQKYKIPLISDEVYMDNIVNHFTSMRKVFIENNCKTQLYSIHSCSKGFIGECGLRGGYINAINLEEREKSVIEKWLSMRLSPNSVGQFCMYAMTSLNNDKEVQKQIGAKKSQYFYKLDYLYKELNKIGYKCIKPEGAMYIFPKIPYIKRIGELAEKEKREYDFIWCREFLKKSGVCVIPGSGFKKSGYFRMTVLPNISDLEYFIKSLKKFT